MEMLLEWSGTQPFWGEVVHKRRLGPRPIIAKAFNSRHLISKEGADSVLGFPACGRNHRSDSE